MLDDLRIRRAAPTDDRQLATIAYDVWSSDTSLDPLPDSNAPFFDPDRDVTADRTLVAFSPLAVVGYVVVQPPAGHTASTWTLRAFAVHHLFQNAGIGMTLVRAAIAATASAGAHRLQAVVHDGNTTAIELLTRAGFRAHAAGAPTPSTSGPPGRTILVRAPV